LSERTERCLAGRVGRMKAASVNKQRVSWSSKGRGLGSLGQGAAWELPLLCWARVYRGNPAACPLCCASWVLREELPLLCWARVHCGNPAACPLCCASWVLREELPLLRGCQAWLKTPFQYPGNSDIMLRCPAGTLSEPNSIKENHVVYRQYGFIAPSSELATTADEAVAKALEIGFPVALKIVSPDIIHKTDVGGVELDLTSEEEVRVAFGRIRDSVRARAPEAQIEGISVEEMCSGGTEIIIGLNNDPQFGPTIMFGLGGIFAEILHDVSFRVLPITRSDAGAMIEEIQGAAVLKGFRGQPPVSKAMLVDLLMNAGRMGMDLADRLDAVDFNPILVWGDEHRVLDAKILLRENGSALRHSEPDISYLDLFFKATSVAVIGASGTPGKIGNAVLDSLANHGYEGQVYPVNPRRDEILGLKAYPSLSAIPEAVELVVVTVGLRQVPDLLRECPDKGVHAMVIISGGGKELGGEAEAVEAEIARLAREHDVRIVGCNCIGVFDGETRLDTPFQTHARLTRPPSGTVSIITQSGTMGAALLEVFGRAGVSKLVSYGNRIDVDEADLLAYLADDPSTKVIVSYIEGLKEGRKFLSTASRVAQEKPIVVFKAGRTPRASSAALSHTGFLGGSHRVWEGAFKQAGLIAVDSFEELHAVGKALAMQPRAKGPQVAMMSNGAGTMIQAIDLFPEYGLELAALSENTLTTLNEAYPPFYVVQNPLDLTGSAVTADYVVGIETLLDDPNTDLLMAWFVFPNSAMEEDVIEALADLNQRYDKPMVCGGFGGSYTVRMARAIEARRLPVYHRVREWVAAAMGLAHQPGSVWRG